MFVLLHLPSLHPLAHKSDHPLPPPPSLEEMKTHFDFTAHLTTDYLLLLLPLTQRSEMRKLFLDKKIKKSGIII
jgi:hypothetical protein